MLYFVIPSSVKYLVFDFGAVIINIDVPRAYKAFADLSGKPEQEVRALFEGGAYWQYEVGELNDDGFRNLIRSTLQLDLPDTAIDEAWNTLLLDVPAARVELLKKLSKRYPIYLLSNTNSIHIRECTEIFRRDHGIENFRNLFAKCFMSFEIGMMKPSEKIYHYVLNDIGCKPEEILFLDDNESNVEAAKAIGINALRITTNHDIHHWLENATTL